MFAQRLNVAPDLSPDDAALQAPLFLFFFRSPEPPFQVRRGLIRRDSPLSFSSKQTQHKKSRIRKREEHCSHHTLVQCFYPSRRS